MTQSTLRAAWGARIQEARQVKGLSVNGLARLAEIDPGNLSRIERGKQGVGDDMRLRIALALDRQVEDLFPYPDTNPETTCPPAASATAEALSRTPATTAATRSPARSVAVQARSEHEANPAPDSAAS